MSRITILLCVLTFTCGGTLDAAAQSFSISDRSAVTYDTNGTGSGVTAGYALVQANAGSSTPAGNLIFSFKDNGILVSETTVPEMLPLTSGRIYAAYFGRVIFIIDAVERPTEN